VSLPAAWLAPPDFAAAKLAQLSMAGLVVARDALGPVRFIGGADISCLRFDATRRVWAAIVVLSWPELELVETAAAEITAGMPYVPGYLGFREVPALHAAWAKLRQRPDLVLVDGHGLAHPRRFGIACHLGVTLDVPSIGVGKSLLVGASAEPLPAAVGRTAPLLHKGEVIGMSLRSRARAGPLHVSVGHRVGLETAVDWVRRLGRGTRLPEPTRLAHLAANAARLSA
jgi:deoxyribonuclease V